MRMFSHTVILKSAAKIGAFFRLCAQTIGFFCRFCKFLDIYHEFHVYTLGGVTPCHPWERVTKTGGVRLY